MDEMLRHLTGNLGYHEARRIFTDSPHPKVVETFRFIIPKPWIKRNAQA